MAVLAALGGHLNNDYVPTGIFEFVGLFVPVWWAWIGYTIYSARLDTDELILWVAAATMMLAAAAMAMQILTALEDGSAGFEGAYVVARAVLLLLYLGVRFAIPQARGMTSLYLLGFSLGARLWAVSVLIPPPARFALWVAGLAVDFATLWLGKRRVLQQAPLDTSHLPDRFELFTLIVLDEAVLGVVADMSQVRWRASSILVAIPAFCIAGCIW